MMAEKQRDREAFVASRTVYSGRKILLKENIYRVQGREKTTEIVHHPGAVVIVPIDAEGRLVLVRQWRRAIQKIVFELPAGTLEKGEDPLVCADRELREETGFKASNLRPVGGFYSAPGYSDEYLHLFFASDLRKDPLPPDEDEGIDVVPVSMMDALHWIENGIIADAKSIAGILRYRSHG